MIEAKNVTKVYNPNSRNANKVLDNASLTLPDSGFIFIVGKSGIGKSTILNAIGGLISYQGDIYYDQKKVDIESYRRKNIGYIFQDFLLFDELTVRDNIRIGLNLAGVYDEDEITRRVNILLHAVRLNINAKRKTAALSLGQRQRVAVARALAGNPHIILADEPTGNLDSVNSFNLMDILKSLSKNHLVICVTHNMNLVNLYADKAYAIIDKKFTEINPKSEKLDETYTQKQVDVSSMSEKDFKDDHTLIRFYAEKDVPDSQISIIRKGDKVIVVGKNISIAQESDVQFSKEDSASSATGHEIKAEDINLDFPPREEKEKFSSSALALAFKQELGLGQSKLSPKRKLTQFNMFLKILLPLIIFIMADVTFGILDNFLSGYQAYSAESKEAQVVSRINEDGADLNSISKQISSPALDQLTYDADNGIIEAGKYNYSYKNVSSGYSSVTSFACSSYYLRKISLSCFDVFNQAVNSSYSSAKTVFNVADISRYETVCPELSSYNLKPDELLIDKSVMSYADSYASASMEDIALYNGNIDEKIIGTHIKLSLASLSAHPAYKTYTIVGVVDTGFSSFFADSYTSQTNRLLFSDMISNAYGYSSSLMLLPDLNDYIIVDYETAKADTSLYAFGADLETSQADIDTASSYCLGLDRIWTYMSNTALEDFVSPILTSQKNFSLINPGFALDTVGVSYLPDPNKKVIVLRNYSSTVSGKTFSVDCFTDFMDMVAYKELIMNGHVKPSALAIKEGKDISKISEVIIPSAWLKYYSSVSDFFSSAGEYSSSLWVYNSVSPNDNETSYITAVGTYQSDSIFDPIYMNGSLIAQLGLRDSPIANYDGLCPLTSLYGYSSLQMAYNYSSVLVIGNKAKAEKAIQSIEDKAVGISFDLYSSRDLRMAVANDNLGQTLRPLVIAICVLLGLLIMISILDNVSRINQEKNKFGIFRCLGMSKGKILVNDSATVFVNFLFFTLIPSLIFLLILAAFKLNYLGIWYLAYLFGLLLVSYLASELPLMLTLTKKPIAILKNIN